MVTSQRASRKVVDAALKSGLQDLDFQPGEELGGDAPVVLIVNLLVTEALRDRASDVHIEPQDDVLRIRFRVDGALRNVRLLPRQLARPIASRLKLLAQMDIVDRHRSQDGQITMTLDGRTIDIRVATLETIWGEKIVLRILDRSRSLLPLTELGLPERERTKVTRLVASPYGLMVVSGPTGSGKTTTLYAALNERRGGDAPRDHRRHRRRAVHPRPARDLQGGAQRRLLPAVARGRAGARQRFPAAWHGRALTPGHPQAHPELRPTGPAAGVQVASVFPQER